MKTERRAALIAVVIVALIGLIAGGFLVAYAQSGTNNKVNSTAGAPVGSLALTKVHKWAWRVKWGAPVMWGVEVSPEYNSTVMAILRSSSETSSLLNEGYYVVSIKPVVKAYISGNGDITLKAAQAVVTLTNGDNAVYVYLVDITNSTVTLVAYYRVPQSVATCRCSHS